MSVCVCVCVVACLFGRPENFTSFGDDNKQSVKALTE